ncbi:MAG: MBL fold metallo-hydrolase [Chloroflexota bacterium]
MAVIVNEEYIRIEKLQLGPWGTNAYIVVCQKTRYSLVVDAPADPDRIIDGLRGTNPRYILLTHDHQDHVGALGALRSRLKVPLAAHPADSGQLASPPEIRVKDGATITLGNLKLGVRHTPGHTPGSLCFLTGRHLLSGDTIFPGGPGKSWSPEAFKEIIDSITGKIFTLPDDTIIYPGHGDTTVLKKEKEEYAVFAARPHDPDLCGDVLWLTS